MYRLKKPKRRPQAAARANVALVISPRGIVRKSVHVPSKGRGVRVAYAECCAICEEAAVDRTLLEACGAKVTYTHRRVNAIVVKVPRVRLGALKRKLTRAGHRYEEAKPVFPMLMESVPMLDVPAVWAAGYTSKDMTVAVVDTGVDRGHPDLRGAVIASKNFTEESAKDTVGHGTHVAGIIAGRGAVYRGVAPGANVLAAKVLGEAGGTDTDVVAGLSWAAAQGAQVVNLSLGGPGTPDDILSRECEALMREGIVVCVAAGNEGPRKGTISSPGMARGVITVGVVDKQKAVAFYSSRGPVRYKGKTIRKPDLLAVGGGIARCASCPYGPGIGSARSRVLSPSACDLTDPARRSRQAKPRYLRMSGTSMATPQAAGACALLLEAAGVKPGAPDSKLAGTIKRVLTRIAESLARPRDEQGAGLINARKALAALAKRS